MTDEDIDRIEGGLRVRLGTPYRTALLQHDLEGDDSSHPEFRTDIDTLIRDNSHFIDDPEDTSRYKTPGLIGAIKFLFLYGSGKRLRNHLRKWHMTWAKGQRFLIGDDMSEERYFIVLSDAEPGVHRYSLETGRSRQVATSLTEWLAHVKRQMAEAEDDT